MSSQRALTEEERRNATALTTIIPRPDGYQSPANGLIDRPMELDSSPITARQASLFLSSVRELMEWRHGVREDAMCIANRPVSNMPPWLSHLKLVVIGKYEENRLGRHVSVLIERDSGQKIVKASFVFVWAEGAQLRGAAQATAWVGDNKTERARGDFVTFLMAKTSFNLLRNSICSYWAPGPAGMGDMSPSDLAMGLTALGLLES